MCVPYVSPEMMEALMVGASGNRSVRWNNQESWWVCDDCKSASEKSTRLQT